MGENRHAISLRDGTVSVDGRILLEASKLSVKYKPELATYNLLETRE